jgi:succinate dehydrogenase/fumarate reductase cytochrome b subunit
MWAERTVYQRAFRATPVALWVLQRASGVLLGPLVALHILVPGLALSSVLNGVLLLVLLVHGYSGVCRLGAAKTKNALYKTTAIAWCIAVALFGSLVVLAGS